MLWRALCIAPLLMLTTAAAPLDQEGLARLNSFVSAGYDPLTAPVDWHRQDPVAGAPHALPLAPVNAEGIAPEAVTSSLNWAERQGSTSLIVMRAGRVVIEKYWHGDGRDTRFNSQSMAKTVGALLVGIAIDRGEIKSVDDPVGKYLSTWRDDPRGHITLRNMLQMSSGLVQIDAGHGYALTPDNPAIEQFFGDDYLSPALALSKNVQPGSRFEYNNNNVLIIAHILERASGIRYPALLSARLWKPLGLADAAIGVDRHGGMALASANIFARPIDWAKIGQLIADHGMADGRRIVSAHWIEEMEAPSLGNKGYGFYLWLGDQRIGGAPLPPVLTPWQSTAFHARDLVMMNGFGGQRVWIMPSKQLVIVRTGRTWPPAWDDAILPNLIWSGS
jgi:CubicO group peptidase (beta-lactamase class C family)